MMLEDLVSVATGSAILAALLASIAARKTQRISAVNPSWQKVRIEA